MTPPEEVTSQPGDGTDVGVRLDRDGPVATLTLCRPDVLNAQTPEMWAALRTFGRDLPGDVRVVILRGAGRAFSAGLDLATVRGGTFAELVRMPPVQAAERVATFQEAFSWLRRPDLITIAAVHGHAIGAGFQLALACDFRVLTDDAQFTMAEVGLGLVPDLGGTKRLVELVGYARALEICLTARRVPAAEAERIGLATIVVGADALDEAVGDLTAAVLTAPRAAAVEIKALLSGASDRTYPEQEALERAAQVRRIRDLAGLDD